MLELRTAGPDALHIDMLKASEHEVSWGRIEER